MGIRDGLNKHPAVAVVAGVAFIIGAVVLALSFLHAGDPPPEETRAYYTTDNGKTWFADDDTKPAPFDHNGQQAVRVYLYKCGDNGKPFPVYLERYSASAQKKILALGSIPRERMVLMLNDIRENGLEIKRLTDKDWAKQTLDRFAEIAAPRCPEGNKMDIQPVLP